MLNIRRTCVSCNEPYRVWFWQDSMQRLHHCSPSCKRAFDYGYEIGLKTTRMFNRLHRFIVSKEGVVVDIGEER